MRRHPLLALLVLIPVLSLLASCGTSGGGDAKTDDKTTTTAAAGDDEGTDEPVDDEATTTEAGGSGGSVSTEALVGILPTAEDIGDGYEVSDEDLTDDDDSSGDESESVDPTDEAILEACPGAKILDELDSGTGNPDEVSREFENEAQATLEVALDPTPDDFTEDKVDTVIEALADCGTITSTDEESGGKITMDITAERNDDFGDFGLDMSMDATFDFIGSPISIQFRGTIFSVDGVTVSVVATSGLDENTFESVPGDYDRVPELAELMQERVSSL